MKVRADRDVPENMVFMPFCYAEAAANLLTNPALDPFGLDPGVQVLRGPRRAGESQRTQPSSGGCDVCGMRTVAGLLGCEAFGEAAEMKVLGISGWSGSGKTALITRLIPALQKRGLRVAVIKHAHHDFDIDIPGKYSFEHRAAGAVEVIIASAHRVAQITELQDAPEPRLADLLRRASACDLVLVEGFKAQLHPKLEVFR